MDCLADTMVERIQGLISSNEKSRTPNESEVRHIATAKPKSKAVDPSVHFRTDHNSRNGFNAGERYIRTGTDVRGDIVQCLASTCVKSEGQLCHFEHLRPLRLQCLDSRHEFSQFRLNAFADRSPLW